VDALEHAEDGRLKRHFVLIAMLCHWVHGTPTAADDALEAGWCALGELANLTLSRDVVEVAEKAFALVARPDV
jgi:8-oxo-dGTP diphosphatase